MLTTYIIGSLALIVKPGPDLTCTIATALSDGKARAATLMLGLVAGCWLWILLLTAGVASFFTAHPATMSAIQIAGAAYIAYLAYGAFADAIRSFRAASPDALRPASGRGFRLGLPAFPPWDCDVDVESADYPFLPRVPAELHAPRFDSCAGRADASSRYAFLRPCAFYLPSRDCGRRLLPREARRLSEGNGHLETRLGFDARRSRRGLGGKYLF